MPSDLCWSSNFTPNVSNSNQAWLHYGRERVETGRGGGGTTTVQWKQGVRNTIRWHERTTGTVSHENDLAPFNEFPNLVHIYLEVGGLCSSEISVPIYRIVITQKTTIWTQICQSVTLQAENYTFLPQNNNFMYATYIIQLCIRTSETVRRSFHLMTYSSCIFTHGASTHLWYITWKMMLFYNIQQNY